MKTLARSDWSRDRAVHLLNRAGFGCTPEQADAAAKRDPAELVDELLSFDAAKSPPPPEWVKPGVEEREKFRQMAGLTPEERMMRQREIRRENIERLSQLRVWWLERMRTGAAPLQERLTLFLHGHFATGMTKVRNAYAMYEQNRMFRAKANGNWEDIVLAVSRDPAMIIYLDNAQNRKGRPNENYARELMELFTLGEGHYTEKDIQESARAFSGWGIHPDRMEFLFQPRQHDNDRKVFFEKAGNLNGEDIVRFILERPRAAEYLARKLWGFFAYSEPEAEVVSDQAAVLRASRMELKPALRAMFLSPAFYSPRAMRTQIKSPVQWLVGATLHLGAPRIPPFLSQMMLRSLGQELFDPPSVKGWDGGPSWITASNLLNRYNFAGILAKGARAIPPNLVGQFAGGGPGKPDKPKKPGKEDAEMDMEREKFRKRMAAGAARLPALLSAPDVLPAAFRADADKAVARLFDRLFQSPLREKDRLAFREHLKDMPPVSKWTATEVQDAAHHLMSTPQYQLT
jgi:uncharacterized protein (DUF1800 family)